VVTVRAKQAGNAIVLTDRDVKIISDIADFGLMTREQIRRQHHFGSVTRINATLLRLVRARYLSRRFQPTLTGWRRALYYVGPAGAVVVASGQSPVGQIQRRRLAQWSDMFVEHQILVNEVRLGFAECRHQGYCFERWISESVLRDLGLDIIPDGYIQYSIEGRTFASFLELDRGTEPLRRWRQKTAAYLDLAFSGRYEAIFERRFFRVFVITTSVRRLEHLRREVAKDTKEIFWFTTVAEVLTQGPVADIWRRPTESRLHALTEG